MNVLRFALWWLLGLAVLALAFSVCLPLAVVGYDRAIQWAARAHAACESRARSAVRGE